MLEGEENNYAHGKHKKMPKKKCNLFLKAVEQSKKKSEIANTVQKSRRGINKVWPRIWA